MESAVEWQATWRAWYEKFASTVYTRCFWELCGDRFAAEDATQGTFLVAMNRLRNGGPPVGNAKAWLLSVAHSQAVLQMRSPEERLDAGRETVMPEPIESAETSALESVSAEEAIALLTAAMPALEPENRRILSLHLQEERGELTRNDINYVLHDELNMSAGAVKKRIFELRKVDGILSQALVMTMLLPTRRRDCEELTSLVENHGARVTPTLRKQVAAHIRTCEQCTANRRKVVAYVPGVASAAPILHPSDELRDRLEPSLSGDVSQVSMVGDLPAGGRLGRGHEATALAAVAAVIAIALIVAGVARTEPASEPVSATAPAGEAIMSQSAKMTAAGADTAGPTPSPTASPSASIPTSIPLAASAAVSTAGNAETRAGSGAEDGPARREAVSAPPQGTTVSSQPVLQEEIPPIGVPPTPADDVPPPAVPPAPAPAEPAPNPGPPVLASTTAAPTRSERPVTDLVIMVIAPENRPNPLEIVTPNSAIFGVNYSPSEGYSPQEASQILSERLVWSIYEEGHPENAQHGEGLQSTFHLGRYINTKIVVRVELPALPTCSLSFCPPSGDPLIFDQDGFFVKIAPG